MMDQKALFGAQSNFITSCQYVTSTQRCMIDSTAFVIQELYLLYICVIQSTIHSRDALLK